MLTMLNIMFAGSMSCPLMRFSPVSAIRSTRRWSKNSNGSPSSHLTFLLVLSLRQTGCKTVTSWHTQPPNPNCPKQTDTSRTTVRMSAQIASSNDVIVVRTLLEQYKLQLQAHEESVSDMGTVELFCVSLHCACWWSTSTVKASSFKVSTFVGAIHWIATSHCRRCLSVPIKIFARCNKCTGVEEVSLE